MNEPEKPKRRFWQIHLSTAVLLMFLAGGILFVNLRRKAMLAISYPRMQAPLRLSMGWPFEAYVENRDCDVIPQEDFDDGYRSQIVPHRLSDLYGRGAMGENVSGWYDHNCTWVANEDCSGIVFPPDSFLPKDFVATLQTTAIVLNAGVALLMLIVSEWIIRRREGRKP